MLRRRQRAENEHKQINERLEQQEQATEEMARRVRLLEIEAGLYKPTLREVNGQ